MLYIDAFNHILPKKYQAVLEQKVPNRDMSSNLSRYAETVPTLLDLDARFRLMDSVEGYMQVLTLAAPTVESVASPEVAVDLCRFANDEMAELVEKYPDRFAAAIAALPLNDLDASLKEIDRAIRDLRLRGIQMYSDVNGMPLDAEALYPIYEKMERYNLPILIHPKRSPALPDYPGEENSRYRAWTKLGWPVASSMAMFRLVYGGVMERFPNLKIVTHHCGGVIPYLAGRMEWNDDFNEMRMGHKDILFPTSRSNTSAACTTTPPTTAIPPGSAAAWISRASASSSSPQISPSATRKACASSATPSPPWTPSISLRGIAARFSRATPWISSGCR